MSHAIDLEHSNPSYYDDESLGVYEKLWISVSELFGLSPMETDDSFLRWSYHHMGMEFEDGIYTFERD
jgi:hypothetical protein